MSSFPAIFQGAILLFAGLSPASPHAAAGVVAVVADGTPEAELKHSPGISAGLGMPYCSLNASKQWQQPQFPEQCARAGCPQTAAWAVASAAAASWDKAAAEQVLGFGAAF